MALGVYDTAVLNKVVDNLKRAQAALLNVAFKEVLVSDKEKIYSDMADGKRRIAPFVHPTMEGKVVRSIPTFSLCRIPSGGNPGEPRPASITSGRYRD